jgi:putative FmdB family regulatory protein
MPIYEMLCNTCGDVVEKIQSFSAPDPACEVCGSQRKKCISSFGIVGTGLLSAKYNDKNKEFAHQEGHWAKATDPKTGKRTVPVFIETFQQQRDYCKSEGFYNPGEIGQVEMTGNDGKSFSSRGLPGAW